MGEAPAGRTREGMVLGFPDMVIPCGFAESLVPIAERPPVAMGVPVDVEPEAKPVVETELGSKLAGMTPPEGTEGPRTGAAEIRPVAPSIRGGM